MESSYQYTDLSFNISLSEYEETNDKSITLDLSSPLSAIFHSQNEDPNLGMRELLDTVRKLEKENKQIRRQLETTSEECRLLKKKLFDFEVDRFYKESTSTLPNSPKVSSKTARHVRTQSLKDVLEEIQLLKAHWVSK